MRDTGAVGDGPCGCAADPAFAHHLDRGVQQLFALLGEIPAQRGCIGPSVSTITLDQVTETNDQVHRYGR